MADSAVAFLLENVKRISMYYVDLLGNTRKELDKLEDELGSLKAFLREAAKRPKKQELLREMERQIRTVVFEIEDTVDSCLTQAIAENANRSAWAKLAKEVKEAREKLKPMLDQVVGDFFRMPDADADADADQPHGHQTFIGRQENVAGFKQEQKEILDFLMEDNNVLEVFSIVGMPGLGKTTLAWKIFHSDEIQDPDKFPIRIWIDVSQEHTVKNVLCRIMKKLNSEDTSGLSDQELTERIRKSLAYQKFLLVLDDVWTVGTWEAIHQVLNKNFLFGKVVITTSQKNVARHARTRINCRPPHHLRFLTDDESWELLQYEVFQKLGVCPHQLEDVGRGIAKKCNGLPKVLVGIGKHMSNRWDGQQIPAALNEWQKIHDNASTYIRQESSLVESSYNKLPEELRDCFLYVGVFPESYQIPAVTLMNLWIAEGFIQQKQDQSMEDTAQEYLKDLINRNLVMIGKINPRGEVKFCRVHKVVREFCHSKAAIGDQNLFQEIKLSKEGVFFPPVKELHKHRRLCIHLNLSKFLSERFSEPNRIRARSFLCFYKDRIILAPKYTSSIPENFKLLRVLDSNSITFKRFSMKVTELIHLRYLTLSFEHLEVLPKAISDLWNLETLFVDTASRELRVEANIWMMTQLRHLKTKAAIHLVMHEQDDQVQKKRKDEEHDTKQEEEVHKNLQTMSRLSPKSCTKSVFSRARNLKNLGIRGHIATLLDSRYSLDTLNRLENLKLVNDEEYESTSDNTPRGFPQSNFFPPNLKTLTLSATRLEWRYMSTLATIDTLQVLKLKNNAFVGNSWKALGPGFHSLQILLISMTSLVSWEASPKHFRSLSCLVIKQCQSLQSIPAGAVESLQKLHIEHVGRSVVERAKAIEEEKKQMRGQHDNTWGGFELNIGPGCN